MYVYIYHVEHKGGLLVPGRLLVVLRRHEADVEHDDAGVEVAKVRVVGQQPDGLDKLVLRHRQRHQRRRPAHLHQHAPPAPLHAREHGRAGLLVNGVDEHANDHLHDEERRHQHPQRKVKPHGRLRALPRLLPNPRRVHRFVHVPAPPPQGGHLVQRLACRGKVVERKRQLRRRVRRQRPDAGPEDPRGAHDARVVLLRLQQPGHLDVSYTCAHM